MCTRLAASATAPLSHAPADSRLLSAHAHTRGVRRSACGMVRVAATALLLLLLASVSHQVDAAQGTTHTHIHTAIAHAGEDSAVASRVTRDPVALWLLK